MVGGADLLGRDQIGIAIEFKNCEANGNSLDTGSNIYRHTSQFAALCNRPGLE